MEDGRWAPERVRREEARTELGRLVERTRREEEAACLRCEEA
jgi:hypothetical protein